MKTEQINKILSELRARHKDVKGDGDTWLDHYRDGWHDALDAVRNTILREDEE